MSDDFSKKYQIGERPYLLHEHNRLNLEYTDVLPTLHNILYPNETLIVEWKKIVSVQYAILVRDDQKAIQSNKRTSIRAYITAFQQKSGKHKFPGTP